MKSEIVMMIRQSSVRDRYIGISIASIYNEATIGRQNSWLGRYYCFKTKKSLIANCEMDRYEVFPGSISQEENWTDSVRSNNNEHARWLGQINVL